MQGQAETNTEATQDDQGQEIEMAADTAILACGGDLRSTIKALIITNAYLETELSKVSYGYARGRVGQQEGNA